MRLQRFDFEVRHESGKTKLADALSRLSNAPSRSDKPDVMAAILPDLETHFVERN